MFWNSFTYFTTNFIGNYWFEYWELEMNGKGKLGKEVGMDMPREAGVVWITSFVHILISLKENKNIYFMGDFNLNLMDLNPITKPASS